MMSFFGCLGSLSGASVALIGSAVLAVASICRKKK